MPRRDWLMGECIPLHHIGGSCGCGQVHTTAEAVQLNRDSGTIGFVCIRGGPPVRDRAPCSVCQRDTAVRADGTVWTHDARDPATGLQLVGQLCAGAGRSPADPPDSAGRVQPPQPTRASRTSPQMPLPGVLA